MDILGPLFKKKRKIRSPSLLLTFSYPIFVWQVFSFYKFFPDCALLTWTSDNITKQTVRPVVRKWVWKIQPPSDGYKLPHRAPVRLVKLATALQCEWIQKVHFINGQTPGVFLIEVQPPNEQARERGRIWKRECWHPGYLLPALGAPIQLLDLSIKIRKTPPYKKKVATYLYKWNHQQKISEITPDVLLQTTFISLHTKMPPLFSFI
jgi:hypothetical protein